MPRISIIMACYNAANFIAESIEGILKQTFSDYELIIVDDASNDQTREIIETFAAKDSRIVVFKQKKNRGPSAARNLGISHAKGTWISINDGDDIAFPESLEKKIEYIEKKPETVLLGSGCTTIDAQGNLIKTYRYPPNHKRLLRRLERMKAFFPHSSCLLNKSALQKLGGFNPRFHTAQDLDLFLRLSEIGEIACLPQSLVKIRKHEGGISHAGDGRSQPTNGIAAGVCHFNRKKGKKDPSASTKDEDWAEFFNWLTCELDQEGFLERRELWDQVRLEYLRSANKIIGLWHLIIRVKKNPLLLRNLYSRIFGSDLTAKLSDRWIRRNKE